MSLQDRVESLKARHAQLELQIADEVRRPAPNPQNVNDMKRKKLKIKDELTRLGAR